MRVLFLISGKNVPSSRFRVLNYLPWLQQAGISCTVLASYPEKYEHIPWLGYRLSYLLKRITRYVHYLYACLSPFDLIFIEREIFDIPAYDMELLFLNRPAKSVLDIDDAIFLRYPEKFQTLAAKVDLLIAGNQNLVDEARKYNDQVRLLPTSVITSKYPLKDYSQPPPGKPVIGWTGLDTNIPNLQLVVPALNRLAEKFEFTLCIISATPEPIAELALDGMEVRHVVWQPETEYQDLSAFDIGIMPLADDEWSRFKCGLKLLQYMALGIPAVASPVGVNAEIIEQGVNGFCAESTEGWYASLEQLLTAPELRKQIGLSGRKTVEEQFDVERNSQRLKQFLEETLDQP
ncbi:Glycosyl transferases group 1 [Gimesia panareensis]|uniref:Glycosyl transferases group 1 n=1 Tax=Gimesia panareensis TaxID=2527978 RepID=A0A518FUV9_9PLAN|nr:glycosyltransferase family 4 protein [Gimesia panareensis]QDV20131.1 Glycosyl transferases group 1 [Gimesia panareensis]